VEGERAVGWRLENRVENAYDVRGPRPVPVVCTFYSHIETEKPRKNRPLYYTQQALKIADRVRVY
jgi:hypothetical protein